MRAKLTHIRNFRLLGGVLLVLCLALVFSPNTFADRFTTFDYTRLFIKYEWAKYNSTTGKYDIFGGEHSAFINPDYDSSTGFYSWTFSFGNQPSSCNGLCYLYVYEIQATPRTYTNPMKYPDSTQANYTHVYLFSQNSFAEGSYKDIILNFDNIYMSPKGKDAWYPADYNSHSSCEDSGSATCKISFWADAVEGMQASDAVNNYYYGVSLDIKNTVWDAWLGTTPSSPYLAIVQYPYNLTTHHFDTTASFLMFVPNNTSPRTMTFYGKVWQDDNADNGMSSEIDLSEASPDFDIENKIINRNTNSANGSAAGLNLGFNVPWIFENWFNLFSNNSCVNIPSLSGMIHSTESTICSPWSSSLRSVLTPMFSILTSMLVFGFVIRWLSHHSKEGSLG